jgi:hypothetical protein
MGKYAKGYMATVTGIFTTALQYSDMFCDTWWPAVVAFVGMVGVVIVPNAKVSDQK